MTALPQPTGEKTGVRIRPLALPDRMRPWHRARVLAEVLTAYIPLLKHLRSNELVSMVDGARAAGRAHMITRPRDPRRDAVRLGSIVGQVLKVLPTDGRCLMQSLVLTRLLAARDIESRIVIGVSVDDGFAAHAWVEYEGRPVLPAGRFDRLHEL